MSRTRKGMPSKSHTAALRKAVTDVVRQWKEVAASARELAAFGDTIGYIAEDLSLTPAELRTLAAKGARAAKELPVLLQTLHISVAKIREKDPLVLRDLQRACTGCDSKRRCVRDIAAGRLAENYGGYCPNAHTVEALSKDPQFAAN